MLLQPSLSHGALQIVDAFFDDEQQDLHVVLEDGGIDLKTFFKLQTKPLSIDQIRHISRQICAAMAYLHSCRVVHRDLKPANILIDPNPLSPTYLHVRIADFGLSRAVELPPGTSNENVMGMIHNATLRHPTPTGADDGHSTEDDMATPQPEQQHEASFETYGMSLPQRTMTPFVVTRFYRAPEITLCKGRYSQVCFPLLFSRAINLPSLAPRPSTCGAWAASSQSCWSCS
jgi:serine/threonine protein kinase